MITQVHSKPIHTIVNGEPVGVLFLNQSGQQLRVHLNQMANAVPARTELSNKQVWWLTPRISAILLLESPLESRN